jgi:3-(3-hydroxy-phenyl)propionate hydroxylase
MADVQVLIIGAGPTGLTLTNILGMYGVRTLLVERNAATVGEPRAVSIDDESLRTMQFIDLAGEVRSRIVEGYGSYYYSPSGTCFAKVVPDNVEYGFPRRSAFRQPVLESQLRRGLERFPAVQARFSTMVVGTVDEGPAVRVRIQTPDGVTQEVRAEYVVACDGAKSGARQALSIEMSGSTYDQRWLIVDLVGSRDRFRHTRVYCNPARPALALPGPDGTRRYEFMALPGEIPEALLEEGRVRSLLARYSEEDARLEIARRVVYQFHARIAQRWRSGRIFLAGDAAHLSPPFAGQGMNSGIRDAHNLGWKLAYVLAGRLGPAALDSYESERKPHAWALIQMAVNMGRVMMPRSRLNAALVQSAFRALSVYLPARDYIMQMKYKPRPRFEHGLVTGDAALAMRGCMFVQPLVERVSGSTALLDDALGKGFAIVELDDGLCPLAPPREDRPLPAALVRVIPRDQRFVAGAQTGTGQVRDASGAIERAFAQAGVRGVVLRPDRYVAAGIPRGAGADFADTVLESLGHLSRATSAGEAQPTGAAGLASA